MSLTIPPSKWGVALKYVQRPPGSKLLRTKYCHTSSPAISGTTDHGSVDFAAVTLIRLQQIVRIPYVGSEALADRLPWNINSNKTSANDDPEFDGPAAKLNQGMKVGVGSS